MAMETGMINSGLRTELSHTRENNHMINRFRRVLILADESADWMVAGLRQLDRLALSIDEFALENRETAPVLVCIFWKPELDQSQRWTPTHERLTHLAFTTELDGAPFENCSRRDVLPHVPLLPSTHSLRTRTCRSTSLRVRENCGNAILNRRHR